MRTFINFTEDSSIYQQYPDKNSGLDEILEIGKSSITTIDAPINYSAAAIRTLVNFDISNISTYPTSSNFNLKFYIANAQNVRRYQTLEVHPVSGSWVEGSGYFIQAPFTASDGVTWLSRNETLEWQLAGGDYFTGKSGSYEVKAVPIQDITIDITDILRPFITNENTYEWNGLIIKFPDTDESSSTNTGNIKVFSTNTHTIFNPHVEVLWNSQVFQTGSLKPIPSSEIQITPRNLKQEYTQGEVDKIYLVVRDPYPDKRFDATQRYKNVYYLPSSSYYRITDEVSGIKIHDFDEYSAINCDASGSYILLDTSGMDASRYYKLELKVENNVLVYFPEFSYTFKVTTHG
jgi:hypothetical protein